MNHSEELLQTAGETMEYARQYARQQDEYYRLEFAGRLAKTTAALITLVAVTSVVALSMVLLSIAAGFYLGGVWGSYTQGFLAVGGTYFLVAAVIYLMRHRLVTNPVLAVILKAFLD